MIPLQSIYLKCGVWRDSVNHDLHIWLGFINASISRKSKAYDVELRIWPLAFNLWRDNDGRRHFKVYKGWVNPHVELSILKEDKNIDWQKSE